MKKQVAIAMGLAVLSTSALASKARLEALGQDANGSFYVDDTRSIFLNPAQLNYHKDFVTIEFGQAQVQDDSAATPRAEGGFFKADGNMVYGLYFNSASDIANSQRNAAMNDGDTEDVVPEQNNMDIFVGGDAGVQWGLRLTYGSYENEQGGADVKSDVARGTVGVITGDLEGYLNFGLGNTAESGDQEFEGKTSFDIGAAYNVGDMDYIAQVATSNAEDEDGEELTGETIKLGAAKNYKLNDRANAWVSAFYVNTKQNNEFTTTGNGENTSSYIPLTVAIEVMAKEWLTLRGSVYHEVFGNNENDEGESVSRTNTTRIQAGAGLTWGDLTLDGMIGNATTCTRYDTGVADDATDDNSVCETAEGMDNGVLSTDNLLSRVSLTYKF